MAGSSNYVRNKILDHVFKVAAFSVPDIWVALSTADPTAAGTGLTEPSGGSYARVNFETWNAAASRAVTNDGAIEFVEATGDWGTITHFAIMDAETSGNMLFYGALSSSKLIENGDQLTIADENLTVSFDTGVISTYLANELLDHIFNTGAYSVPTNLYIGLSTANPGDTAGGLAEPAGSGYARIVANAWNTAAGGATDNDGAITYAAATGSWGTVSYHGIFDDLSAGNMLFYAALTTAKSPTSGDTVRFKDGELDITMNG